MAHEITFTNGVAEMAFVGNRSDIWHGLGQELTPDSPISVWQKEAGMDWDIKSSDLTYTDPDTGVLCYDSKQVLYRSDSKKPLAIVGSGYKVVQPKEVLDFFQSLVSDAGMSLSTAGTLYGGRKFWALADTKQSVLLNDRRDLMNGYILLATSCDGTMATTAQFTSCRVVCNNTLNIALNSSSAKTKVTSSHRSVFKPNDIKGKLGVFESSWDKFAKTMEAMTKVKLTSKDAYSCIMQLVCDEPADPTATELKIVNSIEDLYKGGGMGSDIAGRTAYGLLNAVTEFYDYNVGRVSSNKLNSSFWGQASKSKTAALEFLTNRYALV